MVKPRKVSIDTKRYYPNENEYSDLLRTSKGIDFRIISSSLDFSEPFEDHRGIENSELLLKTVWATPKNTQWNVILSDGNAFILDTTSFGELSQPIMIYSKTRLATWQRDAMTRHMRYLAKLHEIYIHGKVLPVNFFNIN